MAKRDLAVLDSGYTVVYSPALAKLCRALAVSSK
jgi:hypothetical protein